MTRKDYELLAECVGTATGKAHTEVRRYGSVHTEQRINGIDTLFERLMTELCESLHCHNPRFNQSRFEDAVSRHTHNHLGA